MSAYFMYFRLKNNYWRQKSVKSPKLFVTFLSILDIIIASLSLEVDEMEYSISLLNSDS